MDIDERIRNIENIDRQFTFIDIKCGLLEFQNGNLSKAVELFDLAINNNPNSICALQLRALCKTLLLNDIPMQDIAEHVNDPISDLERAINCLRNCASYFSDMPVSEETLNPETNKG